MIYFIEQEGRFVKIGYTDGDPCERLSAMQIGNPHELKLRVVMEGSERDERTLHDEFEAYRVRGEWFVMSPDILKRAKELGARRHCVSPVTEDPGFMAVFSIVANRGK